MIDSYGVRQRVVVSPRAAEAMRRMRPLSAVEAAMLMDWPVRLVREELRAGRIEGIKRGGRWVTDVGAVEDALTAYRRNVRQSVETLARVMDLTKKYASVSE